MMPQQTGQPIWNSPVLLNANPAHRAFDRKLRDIDSSAHDPPLKNSSLPSHSSTRLDGFISAYLLEHCIRISKWYARHDAHSGFPTPTRRNYKKQVFRRCETAPKWRDKNLDLLPGPLPTGNSSPRFVRPPTLRLHS